MSKTTERYGKPIYTAKLVTEWPAQPSKKLLKQWAKQDELAKKLFNKPYDALTGQQQTDICLKIRESKSKKAQP